MKVIEGGRGKEVRETHAQGPRTAALALRAAAAFPDARLTAADTRPFPVVMARGERDRIYDVDGREYLDFHLSSGALVAGHAHPDVQAALRRQVEAGGNFGAMNEAAIDLAERIVAAVPSIDSVKLVVSGTEATLHAIRMARAYTGRDLVLRFEGAYHGHLDMVSLSNKLATLGPADRDRLHVLDHVERRLREQRRVGRVRLVVAQRHHVAVGRGAHPGLRADHPGRAGDVVDDDRLSPLLADLRAEEPRDHVGRAARRERDDHAHGLGRVLLREDPGRHRHAGQRGEDRDEGDDAAPIHVGAPGGAPGRGGRGGASCIVKHTS